MYDNIVSKYEIEIKDLENRLSEFQKIKQTEEIENDNDVSHSMIEFQMSF